MLFGDKSQFAIEVSGDYLDEEDSRLHGHSCFWVNGSPLGSIDNSVMLDMCASWMGVFISNKPSRRQDRFDNLSLHDIHEDIYKIYPYKCLHHVMDTFDIAEKYVMYPDMFHLDSTNIGDTVDSWNIAVIEYSDGRERIIWRRLGSDEVRETVVPAMTVENVGAQFISYIESRK